jgi:hypothetical protein
MMSQPRPSSLKPPAKVGRPSGLVQPKAVTAAVASKTQSKLTCVHFCYSANEACSCSADC